MIGVMKSCHQELEVTDITGMAPSYSYGGDYLSYEEYHEKEEGFSKGLESSGMSLGMMEMKDECYAMSSAMDMGSDLRMMSMSKKCAVDESRERFSKAAVKGISSQVMRK